MIAGAGTVGYSLAQKLSYRHNVIVFDKDIQKLNKLEEDVDIMVIQGDVEDPHTYQGLPFQNADLFIAVTDSDESNLLSTLIVEDRVKIRKKIIRLRNDYFSNSPVIKKLDIDYVVFPDRQTANQLGELFDFPKANNVKRFSQTDYKLISVKVQCDNGSSYRVFELIQNNVVLLGLERDKQFILPDAEETIQKGDLLYLFGDEKQIEVLSTYLDIKMPSKIRKVAIFGANPLAQKIAKKLLERNLEIKMIEKSLLCCKEASEYLEGRATIIHSSYDDHRLFEEEGLKNADMLIAATMNDEKNIVKCIEAKEYGVEKVVAINNDKVYYNLMHQLGIVVVRGSKTGAYYAILESIVSNTVVTERHFCGGEAVLFMREIYSESPLIGKKIGRGFPRGSRMFILHQGRILKEGGYLPLERGDIIIAVGITEEEENIQKWIYTL